MRHISIEPLPFFHRGPSPLTRLAFFGLLSLALLFADTRYRYLENVRQVVAVALYPLQRAVQFPGEALGYLGAYFASQQTTQARWLLVWLLEAGIAVAIAAPAKNRRNRNMVNLLGCFKENWNLHWNCEQVREAALRNT